MQFTTYDFITALKFVAHAAGIKDRRAHLNGVHFIPGPDGLEIFATDGARAAFVTLPQDPGALPATSFHATITSVKGLLSVVKAGRSSTHHPLSFELGPGFFYATVETSGGRRELKQLDARIPEAWTQPGGARALMPDRGPAAETVGGNVDFLGSALRAIKPYTGTSGGVCLTVGRANGDAIKVAAGGAEVLVMPMRVLPDA